MCMTPYTSLCPALFTHQLAGQRVVCAFPQYNNTNKASRRHESPYFIEYNTKINKITFWLKTLNLVLSHHHPRILTIKKIMSLRSLTQFCTKAARSQQASGSRSMSTMLSSINENRFDDHALKANVSSEVYESFHQSVKSGEPCDKATAKAVSKGMFTWATERGATMKAHWFR